LIIYLRSLALSGPSFTYPTMSRKLPNYIRTHRKRFGLKQKELALLLGGKSNSKISEYETFHRLPSLKTALAFQALFGTPVAEIFSGIYQEVEKEVSRKAAILQQKMQAKASDRMSKRKADLLRAIKVTPDINKENL
jgi:transcriptional regulator with XRE-family HTH domain